MQYELPTTLKKLSFSFGREVRNQRTQSTEKPGSTPAPGSYEHKSAFAHTGGWSFGKEELQKTSGQRSPGPGAYNVVPQDFGKFALKYSLRPRPSSPDTLQAKGVPGPGAYEPKDALDMSGSYAISKYRNYKALKFTARHVGSVGSSTPGPGTYQPKTELSVTGDYFIATYRSSQTRRFGKAKSRPGSVLKTEGPGPGTYDIPSDFGIYGTPMSSRMDSRKSRRPS